MPTTITTKVPEKSTVVFTFVFTDTAGDAVTPDSIKWSLSLDDGTPVNARTDVAIGSPAASVDVVLSGLDTAVIANANETRILTVEATYTSTEGSGLPLNEEAKFFIDPLVNVS